MQASRRDAAWRTSATWRASTAPAKAIPPMLPVGRGIFRPLAAWLRQAGRLAHDLLVFRSLLGLVPPAARLEPGPACTTAMPLLCTVPVAACSFDSALRLLHLISSQRLCGVCSVASLLPFRSLSLLHRTAHPACPPPPRETRALQVLGRRPLANYRHSGWRAPDSATTPSPTR